MVSNVIDFASVNKAEHSSLHLAKHKVHIYQLWKAVTARNRPTKSKTSSKGGIPLNRQAKKEDVSLVLKKGFDLS